MPFTHSAAQLKGRAKWETTTTTTMVEKGKWKSFNRKRGFYLVAENKCSLELFWSLFRALLFARSLWRLKARFVSDAGWEHCRNFSSFPTKQPPLLKAWRMDVGYSCVLITNDFAHPIIVCNLMSRTEKSLKNSTRLPASSWSLSSQPFENLCFSSPKVLNQKLKLPRPSSTRTSLTHHTIILFKKTSFLTSFARVRGRRRNKWGPFPAYM